MTKVPTTVGEKSVSRETAAWFSTSDTQLASFLYTCGCPMATPRLITREKADDPNFQISKWRFECSSKSKNSYDLSLEDTVAAWKDAYNYIANNQDSPVSLILAGFKNFEKFKAILSDNNIQSTIVDYRVNGQTLSLIKGSQKEKKLRKKLGYE